MLVSKEAGSVVAGGVWAELGCNWVAKCITTIPVECRPTPVLEWNTQHTTAIQQISVNILISPPG